MRTKDLAKDVLKAHWDRKLPVDVFAIAKKLMVEIIEDLALEREGMSGSFSQQGKRPIIRLNPTEADVRKRFTAAHELGHFVLHHGSNFRDPKKNFSII